MTITLPDAGRRFLSMQVINEYQYTMLVAYGAGSHTLRRETVGTRYVAPGIRILVDPSNAADVQQVQALQDAIKVEQPGGPGKFDVPNWDMASRAKVRNALLLLKRSDQAKRATGLRLRHISHTMSPRMNPSPLLS